jgi:hypothetical protein
VVAAGHTVVKSGIGCVKSGEKKGTNSVAKSLREIVPLDEIKLSRITRALDAREPVGTVSPEKYGRASWAANGALNTKPSIFGPFAPTNVKV